MILVDLEDREARGLRTSVTGACAASRLTGTTALRHIGTLVETGLLERVRDSEDRRRTWIALTPDGRALVRVAVITLGRRVESVIRRYAYFDQPR